MLRLISIILYDKDIKNPFFGKKLDPLALTKRSKNKNSLILLYFQENKK